MLRKVIAPEMPPLNLFDPIIARWLDHVSPTITKDGKTAVEPLTHWPNGEPIQYIGTMADDLERLNPEAVHEFDGVKVVDYTKAAQTPGLRLYSFNYRTE